jgi:hypothetical protein
MFALRLHALESAGNMCTPFQPLTEYLEPLIDLLEISPAILPSTGAFPAFNKPLGTLNCHPGIYHERNNP